jgi:hypothetical protein
MKLNLSLCFNWALRHDGVLGNGGISTNYLTSALDGGELSASRRGSFTPKERAHGTHWIGGWVGPRAGLDAVVNSKISSPCQNSKPDYPAHSFSAIPLSYPDSLLKHKYNFTFTFTFTLFSDITVPYCLIIVPNRVVDQCIESSYLERETGSTDWKCPWCCRWSHENSKIVLSTGPRPLPYRSFRSHYSRLPTQTTGHYKTYLDLIMRVLRLGCGAV